MSYSYRNPAENEELVKKEEKVTSKLNELGFVTCPQCRKKLVRVFAPRSGTKPVYRDDVQSYLRRMRKTMKRCEGRGAKSECHISGPEYTIVYNSNHFTKPYADNLGVGAGYGHCGRGVYLGYSPVAVVSRLFLRHAMIRRACIANGVEPEEVRTWMGTLDNKQLSKIFGYGFELQQIENTNLWAGTYAYSEWKANTCKYDVSEVAGPEWSAEMDPIVADPPPTHGRRSKYTMSPTHGAVQYTNKEKLEIAIDLPAGVEYRDLEADGWMKIANIRTSTGALVKMTISHETNSAQSINSMTRALTEYNAPRKFWVVQPWAYQGSTKKESGDIVL